MYKIENLSEKIYVYDVHSGYYTHAFPSIDDMLKFLASNSQKNWYGNTYSNTYLDNINMGNDKYYAPIRHQGYSDSNGDYQSDIEYVVCDKQYMFVDGDYRIIDPRIYKSKIDFYRDNDITDYVNLWKKKKKYRWYRDIPYEFRSDPVPIVGSKCSRGRYYRHPQTMNERRLNSIPEYKEFVRPSRCGFALPTVYDDIVRSRLGSKSWKDCTKKRKQWM